MIKIYDTMTRSLRDFVPLTENVVNMYVCGPTVYNYIHIGNARSAVAFDTIRRYFEYCGYTVNYISNFTDVDDKIIKAANEAGISTKELSDKFIAAFMEDTAQLGRNTNDCNIFWDIRNNHSCRTDLRILSNLNRAYDLSMG